MRLFQMNGIVFEFGGSMRMGLKLFELRTA